MLHVNKFLFIYTLAYTIIKNESEKDINIHISEFTTLILLCAHQNLYEAAVFFCIFCNNVVKMKFKTLSATFILLFMLMVDFTSAQGRQRSRTRATTTAEPEPYVLSSRIEFISPDHLYV